jgi:putative transposase
MRSRGDDRHKDELIAVPRLVWVTPAASLVEGLGETLTVLQLGVHARLRRSLSSTNGIESSFSVVDKICQQGKRWRGSDHRLRWVASAMLFAESRWNRLHGYRHLPLLLHNLQRAYDARRALNGDLHNASSVA